MDILTVAAIRVPCPRCGEAYPVPLSNILLSHRIMHDGCPGIEETECPPVFESRLASKREVENLRRAWQKVELRARKDGGELVLMQNPRSLQGGQAKSDQSGPVSLKLKSSGTGKRPA